MSDRESLIARVLPMKDISSAARAALARNPSPSLPSGFVSSDAAALVLSRRDENVLAATYVSAELRVLGRSVVRAALIGAPYVISAVAAGPESSVDRCYRALLDFVFAAGRNPHMVTIALAESQEDHADVLWRLALALDARLTIRDVAGHLELNLFTSGQRGDLAALVIARPYALARAMFRQIGPARPKRRSNGHDVLAVLALDLTEAAVPVIPQCPVEFSELPLDELRRRPRRYGVPLSAALHESTDRCLIVGRVDGRAVFQAACSRSAPVLKLLSPEIRARLVEPVALVSDARTDPEFRNRSIFAAALQWSARWASGGGVRTLVALIRIDNAASLRAAAKAGFRRLGEVTVVR